MSDCNHDCSNCASANCGQRNKESLKVSANANSRIKKIIGVVSGKGGVGKSMVTSLLACTANDRGYSTAILDADITGPSIPQAFGISGQLYATETDIIPAVSSNGVKVVSTNLILPNPSQPVLWRGPVIGAAVKQYYSNVNWGDVDYMFVDMPPGTGDVALTVFQSLPVDGIIIVSTPQQLVSMIVAKAINMASMMKVPVIGLVENMSFVECDNCGNKIELFGSSNSKQLAEKYGIDLLAQLPLNSALAASVDNGLIEEYRVNYLDAVMDKLESL